MFCFKVAYFPDIGICHFKRESYYNLTLYLGIFGFFPENALGDDPKSSWLRVKDVSRDLLVVSQNKPKLRKYDFVQSATT